jgi:transmembrane sensor
MGTQVPAEDRAAAVRRGAVRELTSRGRWTLATGFAACLVAAIGGLTVLQRQDTVVPAAALYAAGSETRQITLDDGTRVHLDVHSHLEVRYTPARRDVVLSDGRAIFDVARDTARPFEVSTAFGVVTALGTRFEVRQAESMIVTLAEGSVTVAGLSAGEPKEYLQPGEQLMIADDRAGWVKRQVDVEAETGWSVGRLTFRAVPLTAAVAEVNRYAAMKVRIADPSLANMPVSGSVVAGDSAAAVAAFAAVLPIRMADGGNELLLFRRWEPTAEQRTSK